MNKEKIKIAIRYLLQASIIGYLCYQLYDVGVLNVLISLPENPFFYLIIIVIYFSLPLSEIFIYRVKWKFDSWQAFFVFIKKKVVNAEIFGYAGEIYFLNWARKELKIPVDKAFSFIKDNNILSSISSTSVSIILLVFFSAKGYLNPFKYIPNFDDWYTSLIVVCGVLVALFVIYKLRYSILAVSLEDGLKISTIYTGRLLITNFLQILQYVIVKPEVPLAAWFSLVAIQIISTRIPFLPSRDVLYVGLGMEMSGIVQISKTDIAGLLTANLLVTKILGLFAFGYLSVNDHQSKVSEEKKSN